MFKREKKCGVIKSIRIVVIISYLYTMFCFPGVANAQSGSNTEGTVKKFGKGFIVKKDRKRFNGKSLVFDSQSLTFKDIKTANSVSLPLSEIEYVRVKTGNRVVEGALVGGGFFLLIALLAYAKAEEDPYTEVTNAGQVIGIMTAIGIGGGLVVGAMIKKEKTVYQKGKFLVKAPDFKPVKQNIEVSFISLRSPF